MALFGRKKETKQDTKKESAAAKNDQTPQVTTKPGLATDVDYASIIQGIRISEKSVSQGERNVYAFVVRKDANKYMVKSAVQALYNVTPVKVNIVNKRPAKRLQGARGRQVHEKGMKKAYVYLKKGDQITIV